MSSTRQRRGEINSRPQQPRHPQCLQFRLAVRATRGILQRVFRLGTGRLVMFFVLNRVHPPRRTTATRAQ